MIPEAFHHPHVLSVQRFLGTQRASAAIFEVFPWHTLTHFGAGRCWRCCHGTLKAPGAPIDLAELTSICERVCFQRLEASPKRPSLWPIRTQRGTCLPPVHHCSRSSASQLDHACSGRKSPQNDQLRCPARSTA